MTTDTAISKPTTNTTPFFIVTFILTAVAYGVATLLPEEAAPLAGLLITPMPIIAALLLSLRDGGLRAATALLKRAFDIKRITNRTWYLPVLLLLPVLFFIAFGIVLLLGTPLPAPSFPLAALPVILILFFVLALFEEAGWMGYAFEPMQQGSIALRASIILGIIWALWHIPLYVFFQGQGLQWIAIQVLSLIAMRVLIVWIYNNTGKSLFAVILFHAILNISAGLFRQFPYPARPSDHQSPYSHRDDHRCVFVGWRNAYSITGWGAAEAE